MNRSSCFSGILLLFSMIQWMLAIWSMVPLPFLNPACTSGSSQFIYCWSLTWRILSKSCWHVKWVKLHSNLNILWHWFSLGLEWKLTFFQSCGYCWLFQICWYNECSTLKATSFKIWNSSAGISLPPLALFVVCPCWIVTPGQLMGFRAANGNGEMGVPSAPGCDTTSAPAFPRPSSQPLQQGLLLNSWLHVTDSQWPVKV